MAWLGIALENDSELLNNFYSSGPYYFAEKGDYQSLIYILTNNFKINFIQNSQFVCAKELSNSDSKVLRKDPGTPCLSQDCLLFDDDNRLVLVDQNITFNTLSFNSRTN